VNFLRLCARTDDRRERIQAYRDQRMPGHDSSDSTVSRRITKLLARDDAIGFLEAERERVRAERAKAMHEADVAGWERQIELAKLDRANIRLLLDTVEARRVAVLANPGKPASDVPKLAEIAHRVAGEAQSAPPMSPEDRLAQLKAAGIDVEVPAEPAEAPPESDGELLFDAQGGVA